MDLYVAPGGNDGWTGCRPAPNRGRTDGPLATLAGARNRLRELRGLGVKTVGAPPPPLCEPVSVWVRGGRYELTEPLVFGPEDSHPTTFAAWRNEKPILDGSSRVTGWRVTKINGRRAWMTELPEVAEGKWAFRSLFVDGRRAPRPRWPNAGLFRMESVPGLKLPASWGNGGQTRFVAAPEQVQPFHNASDVEVVYLHFWVEERSPIVTVDMDRRLVTLARPSRSAMVGSHGSQLADYYYDNVFEALTEPGQWYLDRPRGLLYYLPLPGQTPRNTPVHAPRCVQLLALIGEPDQGRFVEHVRFRGLRFKHTDWRHPSFDGVTPLGSAGVVPARPLWSRRQWRGAAASGSQAANDVPGVVLLEGARHCAVEDCVIQHVGWYGLEVGEGCRGVRVVGNTFRDLGAGGVKVGGMAARDLMPQRQTGHVRVTDNHITAGGRVFHSAVGVLSTHAFAVVIAHNHIHDLFYTGVSCGWEWGFQENVSRDNRIEKNHIHDIGQGLLSDMGGIYTLGVQPGTVIRGNLVHDVRSAHYGGWCIYNDEGSSHIVVEHNVCYDADREAYHQHYGRENTVRNNLLAFGGDAVIRCSRGGENVGVTFMHNILVTDGKPFFTGGYMLKLRDRQFCSDLNVLFDVSGKPPVFGERGSERFTLSAWRRLGQDVHSVAGDPGFRNWRRRDFHLRAGSPTGKVGFEPIDLSDVGPRPRSRHD